MTIITYTKSLKYYPYKRIQTEAVDVLLKATTVKNNYVQPNLLIKIFEAFCDITSSNVSFISIQHPGFSDLAHGFIGSLFSGEMLDLEQEKIIYHIDAFYRGVGTINPHIMRDERFELNSGKRRRYLKENKDKFIKIWETMKSSLDHERLNYWGGFSIKARKERLTYLALQGIYNEISPELAKSIHKLISENSLKRSLPVVTEYNKFFHYLVKNKHLYNELTFQDRKKIDVLFKSYCRDFFINELKEKKLNKHSVISRWNEFSGLITEVFIAPGVWVNPISGKLPHIINEGCNAKETHIREDSDGIEVKQKLLTDIPMSVTDKEAIEILFGNISNDINIIKSWAIFKSKDLYQRYLNRKKLALKGKPFTSIKKEFGRIAPEDDELICHLAATFEDRGHKQGFDFRFQQRMNVKDIMYQLGIPQNSYDLDPYKVLLTIEHPEITPDFLRDLELYDKRGNLVGFVEIDGVYWLSGYKDRKTPEHAEQKIKLTDFTAQLVKEAIEVTESVRLSMKAENDDLWRFLFINFSGGTKKKIRSVNITYNKSQRDRNVAAYINFRNELKNFTNKRGEDLDRYIWKVSLTTIRASSAVLVYLETNDIQKMSKALGHTNVTKDRLREYLPEPILAFFQSRWVRIFQKAIICESMKDSEYLLKATKFDTIEALHQFLTNHALKKVPKYVMDDNIDDSQNLPNESQVYFSVDTGILVSLLSIEKAVKLSPVNKSINGYARYWSKVSELITKEIERSNDKILKFKLNNAMMNINIDSMENIIYETSI